MGIGVSVFFIAVGAILAFAVEAQLSGVSLELVGYILMGVGVVGLIMAIIVNSQRSNTSHTVVEDRHVRDDRP